MNDEEKIQALRDIADETGGKFRSYSGRGMYGKNVSVSQPMTPQTSSNARATRALKVPVRTVWAPVPSCTGPASRLP